MYLFQNGPPRPESQLEKYGQRQIQRDKVRYGTWRNNRRILVGDARRSINRLITRVLHEPDRERVGKLLSEKENRDILER